MMGVDVDVDVVVTSWELLVSFSPFFLLVFRHDHVTWS